MQSKEFYLVEQGLYKLEVEEQKELNTIEVVFGCTSSLLVTFS
jgi:hypothetical protein